MLDLCWIQWKKAASLLVVVGKVELAHAVACGHWKASVDGRWGNVHDKATSTWVLTSINWCSPPPRSFPAKVQLSRQELRDIEAGRTLTTTYNQSIDIPRTPWISKCLHINISSHPTYSCLPPAATATGLDRHDVHKRAGRVHGTALHPWPEA